MEGNLDTRFNYRSGRATEARFYAKYGKVVLIGCTAMMALISLLGVVLLLSGQGLGWLILSIGMWFAVPVLWVRLRLKVLPASRQPRSINDVLSGEVLGLLPDGATPHSVMSALSDTNGAHFFAVRFGLSISHLTEVTPDDAGLLGDVWAESLNVWMHLPDRAETISSAVVIAAIIRLNPAMDDMLNNLRIDRDAIFAGVAWFEHINGLARSLGKPRLTGGIARDWW